TVRGFRTRHAAEFHDRVVPNPRLAGGHEFRRRFLEGCLVVWNPEGPVEHAFDVGIDDGVPLVERKTRHRVRGVETHALQFLEFRWRFGKFAVERFDDLAGGLVEIARPIVVAETVGTPKAHYVGAVGIGERLDSGPALSKVLERFHYAIELGLLAHHFRDRYFVGVRGFAPRKISMPLLVPFDQRPPDGPFIGNREFGFGTRFGMSHCPERVAHEKYAWRSTRSESGLRAGLRNTP